MASEAVLLGLLIAFATVALARVLQLPSSEDCSSASCYFPEKRPLIGILSQPGDGDDRALIEELEPDDPRRLNVSYIAASYVKFVEAGGARAVPLLYNEPEESLRKKFSVINGILFPGGSALKDPAFYNAVEFLFKLGIEANDKGDYFPIWGTCLGLELLTIVVTGNHSILEKFNAVKTPAPLNFVGEWAKERSLFKWFPVDVLQKIESSSIALENHVNGVSPERWTATPALTEFFDVLTTTPDLDNKLYVSTVQGRKYPVTGVQWHPEKNAFEWGYSSIPHTPDAIRVTQSAASFFVSEALKSEHKATRGEEEEFIIYNESPIYSGKDGPAHFDQAYVFW